MFFFYDFSHILQFLKYFEICTKKEDLLHFVLQLHRTDFKPLENKTNFDQVKYINYQKVSAHCTIVYTYFIKLNEEILNKLEHSAHEVLLVFGFEFGSLRQTWSAVITSIDM